tara:strand:+ start:116 stop:616 length:501 start_codon:yes stop_codon:yes gene_type:complete
MLHLLSLGFEGPMGMKCPSTGVLFDAACGMEITTTATATCADVQAEMEARIAGQYGSWHDPHNNGTYSVQSYGGTFSSKRLTGDGKYTDKQIFTLTASGSGCLIEACSRSQVGSYLDGGTNYCDLKMLFCGTADGCKPLKNDFTVGTEKTKAHQGSTAGISACLKV